MENKILKIYKTELLNLLESLTPIQVENVISNLPALRDEIKRVEMIEKSKNK